MSPEYETLIKVCTGSNAKKIKEHFHKVLNSRPHTLLHYDIHAENMFVDKKDPKKFTLIDW